MLSNEQTDKLTEVLKRSRENLVNHFQIYHASTDYVPPADFHHKISDILLNEDRHFAVEAFRESGKSSYVLLDFPTYILQFPREDMSYIVIIKQNQISAEDKMKQVINAYLNHPILSMNLVKVVRNSGKAFEVIVKDIDGNEINIVFEAYGKGAALRGLMNQARRPHLVLIDDPQDFEDSRSETTLKRDWEWFLSDVKNLGVNTRIFIIGNNLGANCIIERVFDFADDLGFTTLKIPAITDDGASAWDSKFTLEFLESEKEAHRKMGELDIWYRERMCQVMSDDTREFKTEYFQYYDTPPKVCIKMAVDPAISQKEDADYTGICVAGMSENHNIYILDTVKKKMLPDQIIDTIFSMVKKWTPANGVLEVGIEGVQYQKMLILEVKKQMRIRNQFFMLTELQPRGEKEARIRSAMQARYAAKSIFHKPTMSELEDELFNFPFGKNDDLIDAEAHCISMLINAQNNKTPLTYSSASPNNRGRSDIGDVFGKKRESISITPSYNGL